jgi:chromatin remodeling complex protein RSC6
MNTATPATKVTKKVTKKTEEAAAPAPVVAAPAEAAAPKKATKKAATPASVAPVAATPAPVASSVTAAPVESAEAPVASVQDDVKSMLTQANTVRETVGALVAELKRLEKRVARLQKEADKRRRRSSKKLAEGEEAKPRKPSIFELPTPLSNDLCGFLGVSNGSKESRSNVTKKITTYVKEHELKDKHTIKPDAKLKALLGVKDGETLTYFNLQRYLNRHYLKPAATA